jgi:hypothetical protein
MSNDAKGKTKVGQDGGRVTQRSSLYRVVRGAAVTMSMEKKVIKKQRKSK